MTEPKEQPERQPEEEKINGHKKEYLPSKVYEHVEDDIYVRIDPQTGEEGEFEYSDDVIPPTTEPEEDKN